MKSLVLVALATGIAMFADSFKVYPGAKLSAKGDKTESYSTLDPFAKVAYFYRAIGKEQKMPDGDLFSALAREFRQMLRHRIV